VKAIAAFEKVLLNRSNGDAR